LGEALAYGVNVVVIGRIVSRLEQAVKGIESVGGKAGTT
jgi:hypothetical protein